jgi:hypothetical protein
MSDLYIKKPNGRYAKLSANVAIKIRQHENKQFDVAVSGDPNVDLTRLADLITNNLNRDQAWFEEFMQRKTTAPSAGEGEG